MFNKLNIKWLESNIWKVRIYMFTNRRAYITLLWIYFLTFPDNTIKQIGLYTSLWSLVWFLMEIPSGYLSDRFGYKKILILSKIFMICATLSFILWNNIIHFAIGSICISLGFAFVSWTMAAFFHETLEEMWKWKYFTKILWRLKGSVSLFNAILIVAIPFLTKISFEWPFYIGLIVDVIWLIVAISLVTPKKEKDLKKPKSIVKILKETKWIKLWPIIGFVTILYGVSSSTNAFRYPYLESLWYPIIYIWLVMGLSRVVRFLVSRIAHKIEEKIPIKKLLFIEIFIFSGAFFLIATLKNPYIVWWLLSLIIGYYRWRDSLIQNYIINIIPDKKYKATILSVRSQLSSLLSLWLIFILWYIMNYSYNIWFLFLAITLFIGLSISYIFIRKI